MKKSEIKILVVDDTLELRTAMVESLNAEGFDTISANDGKSAINSLKKNNPDFIVLDFKMPGIDGISLAKIIKSQWAYEDTPIILVTGFANTNVVKSALNAKIAKILCKPFPPNDLIKAVKEILKIEDTESDSNLPINNETNDNSEVEENIKIVNTDNITKNDLENEKHSLTIQDLIRSKHQTKVETPKLTVIPENTNENINSFNNEPNVTADIPTSPEIEIKEEVNQIKGNAVTEQKNFNSILILGGKQGDISVFEEIESIDEKMKFSMCDNIKLAATILGAKTFNAILIEWSIHGDSGLSLARAFKTNPKLASVSTAMLSYGVSKLQLMEAAKIGIANVFIRPLEVYELTHGLNDMLQGKKALNNMLEPEKKSISKKEVSNDQPWIIKDETGKDIVDLDRLTKRVRRLLSPPYIITRIVKIINSPKSSGKDLSTVIKTDAALTFKILQLINSPYYGLRNKVKNIEHAVGYLGFEVVKKICLGVASYETLSKKKLPKGFEMQSYWEHCLATAVLARSIARILGHKAPEDLFIAGLLHDSGKTVLSEFVTDLFIKAFFMSQEKEIPLIDAETETMGLNHTEIGSVLMNYWKIPEELVTAIADHHLPFEKIREKKAEYTGILKLANQMAKARLLGYGGDIIIDDYQLNNCDFLKILWKYRAEIIADSEKELTIFQEFIFAGNNSSVKQSAVEKRTIMTEPRNNKNLVFLSGQPVIWNMPYIILSSAGYNVTEMSAIDGVKLVLKMIEKSIILVIDNFEEQIDWLYDLLEKLSKREQSKIQIVSIDTKIDNINPEKIGINTFSRPIHIENLIKLVDRLTDTRI